MARGRSRPARRRARWRRARRPARRRAPPAAGAPGRRRGSVSSLPPRPRPSAATGASSSWPRPIQSCIRSAAATARRPSSPSNQHVIASPLNESTAPRWPCTAATRPPKRTSSRRASSSAPWCSPRRRASDSVSAVKPERSASTAAPVDVRRQVAAGGQRVQAVDRDVREKGARARAVHRPSIASPACELEAVCYPPASRALRSATFAVIFSTAPGQSRSSSPELGSEEHQHVGLRRRRDRRGAPCARDDRHLAEEVAWPERLEELVAVLDVHRPVLDHEEAVARRAFDGQPGPRRDVAALEHARDLGELVRVELGEERDRADAVDLDGHSRADRIPIRPVLGAPKGEPTVSMW